jgi:hypothetical protein
VGVVARDPGGRTIDGIQAVQARIAQIQQMVASLAPPGVASAGSGAAASGSATGGVDASSGTFAAAMNTAQAGDKQQWANDFLTRLGMPVTAENVRAVVAWEKAEGTKAQFNPLATTRSMPGATNFNSVGVKNFASYADGIEANAAALTTGRYGNILAALRQGNSAVAVAQAIANSPWGTGNGVLRVLQSG